jgi:hydroxylamine reductase
MKSKMFCFQCQETLGGNGCTTVGLCGKPADLSNLQDLLIYVSKSLSGITTKLRECNKEVSFEVNFQITKNLFATITNANYDENVIREMITKTLIIKSELIKLLDKNTLSNDELFTCNEDKYLELATTVGVLSETDEDIRSLKELIIYGLKGMAAYVEHANVLDKKDDEIDAFLQSTLATLLRKDLSVAELVTLTLKTGEIGVNAMALLDGANTGTYGNPEITTVNIGVGKNPGILISGHDLKDLEQLLEQTQGTGIDIYTHSEMLPAHYYPAFKKFDNFVGNYGNAWWQQQQEFESFNGPILMTTNCIVKPLDSYKSRIFSTGVVGYDGITHIKSDENGNKDFSQIIELAKKSKAPIEIETGTIVGGFAHNQVFALADNIVEAVKSGAIKKFVVMAGCDGRHNSRNYYTEFAEALPKDTVILTAGCAKYRFNKLNLGDINGIPRVLDAGQCNDSYSLALIALKLQEIFELNSINDLPIVYNISWYEQKAVIVLLALLHLNVNNIHLGPTLPAFLSENVLNVLIDNFNIGTISTVEEDMSWING